MPEGATLELAGGGRRVAVTFVTGYPVVQVYAPPGEALICFEPMTAPTDAWRTRRGLRVLRRGERFAAAFDISVSDS